MEDVITQKFNYATITLFKDYCKIGDKKETINFNGDLDFFEDEEDLTRETTPTKKLTILFGELRRPKVGRMVDFHKQIDKRRTRYFYGDSEIGERVNMNYAIYNFETRNDRHIKRHYGNPFSEITVNAIERSIRRHGDKVTIKIYRQHKHRQFNSIYFKKSMSVTSVTFNLVTGNFTTLNMTKVGKKITKTFRTNNFNYLEQSFRDGGIIDMRKPLDKDSVLLDEHNQTFDNKKFVSVLNDVFNLNQQNITFNGIWFTQLMLERFVELKKIKICNDYSYWIKIFYPTEKFLKKNDRKLIASILDMFGIKSKITIKIMHENSKIDIQSLARLCYYFGDNYSKYIGSIDPIHFLNSRYDNSNNFGVSKFNFEKEFKKEKFLITNIEKENIVKIINSLKIENKGFIRLTSEKETIINERFIGDLHDHFRMIGKLREYVPDLHLKSKHINEFNDEHHEISKMMKLIKKGWEVEYQFADKMVSDVELPIDLKINLGDDKFGDITFYPYILKREVDYDEEGRFMHHCVASYSDKEKSIVISIRTENKQDRVTCEFDCQTGTLIQARHFCNNQPPADIEMAVDKLKEKTKIYARMGILHSLDKKKVPIKINGIEVMSEHREPRRIDELIQEEVRRPIPF